MGAGCPKWITGLLPANLAIHQGMVVALVGPGFGLPDMELFQYSGWPSADLLQAAVGMEAENNEHDHVPMIPKSSPSGSLPWKTPEVDFGTLAM